MTATKGQAKVTAMKDVLRLMRFTPRYSAGLLATSFLLMCVIPLPLGLATRAFFDAFRPGAASHAVWLAIAVVVASQLGLVLSEVGLSRMWSGQQWEIQSLFQHNLLRGVLRGYGRTGLRLSPPEAVSRFRDEPPTITLGSVDASCDLIARTAFAVAAFVVMARIDVPLTVVAFAPILVSSLLSDSLGTRASRYGAEARQARGRVTGFLGELCRAQLALKVAGATPHAVARLTRMGEERRKLSVRDTVFGQMLDSLNFHVVHLSTGLVLLLGAGSIRAGRFSVGDFALFVVYLDQLTYLPAEIGRLITELKRTDNAIGRMHALMPTQLRADLVAPARLHLREAPPTASPPAAPPAFDRLEVRNLTFRHPASGRGIDGISFVVEPGTVTVITGRVGSGKSTLLHALLGLVTPDAGEVRWNGEVVDDPASLLVPGRTAFTPQVPRLFSDTLRENVHLGADCGAATLHAAAHAAVLDTEIPGLEAGYDTAVGPRGVKLSGGQVQRVAAARMFVRSPQVLVFDDLSSALDGPTEAQLWSRLFSRPEPPTCLVVSHRPAALRRADQVLLLEDGRLADAGRLEDLLHRSSAMQDLWAAEDG